MIPVESSPPKTERSESKPLAMAVIVLTCALAGTAIHHFSRSGEGEPGRTPPAATADLRGAPIDAPPKGVEATPETAAEPALPSPTEHAPGSDQAPEPPDPLPRLGLPPAAEAQAEAEPESGGPPALYKAITFEQVADWTYEFPDVGANATRDDPIPERIRAWSGTRIAIRGFMIPVKLEGEDSVTEFLLVRNQFACCFGVVPKMNEWVHVVMAPGKTSKYLVDVPITVRGTFDASELIEDGLVMSLYRITADAVDEPAFLR